MPNNNRWLLPEGIRETLSPEALAIENNRRSILDMYYSCGYELVRPPLIDYLDSLLTGTGHDLELMTFTVTDQLSGKLLGIRADMTPQIARIDAHYVKADQPSRFCYLGEVLHTKLDGFSQSRSPVQTGAEIYGYEDYHADIEIIQLMINTLRTVGVSNITIDLGHVGIFRHLCQQGRIEDEQVALLFEALQRKAVTEIDDLLTETGLPQALQEDIKSLLQLHGSIEVLDQALSQFTQPEIISYLETLKKISLKLQSLDNVCLFFDLAELRGFNYHTGLVFSAYMEGYGQALAHGGRYDGIGEKFGRPRAATGFSTDLAQLVVISGINKETEQKIKTTAIFAPYVDEQIESDKFKDLEMLIINQRQMGERVVCELPGQSVDLNAMGCDRRIEWINQQWQIVSID